MMQKTSHINVVELWESHKAGAGGTASVATADSGFSELVASRVNESLSRFCRELPVRRSRGSVLRRAAKLFVSNSSPAQIVSPTLRISHLG